MPSLFDVATHFDDIVATDGYTGAALFKAQASTFLGASPDGSTSQKRVISVAPSISMPSRKVVTLLSETYIVGLGILDGIFGQAIRKSYWTKLATDGVEILTPGQACLATAGITAYAHLSYLKDTVNGVTDAEYDPFWEIFFSTYETIVKGSFFRVGTNYYRARSIHLTESGFQNAASDEIDAGARVSVTFAQTGAYDPVLDTYAAGSLTTNGILLDRYKTYNLLTSADKLNHAGDMSLMVAISAVTPVVGRNITISGRTWQILNSTTDQDAWELHIRRA